LGNWTGPADAGDPSDANVIQGLTSGRRDRL